MGHLFLPSQQRIKGPWLIDQKALEKLDCLLESIHQKLVQVANTDNAKEGNTNQKKLDVPKNAMLIAKNKSRIEDSTLLGILRDPKAKDFDPLELNIKIGYRYLGPSFLLSVDSKYDGELEYSVECKNDQIRDEINYNIDAWVEELKPNKFLQFWSNWLPYLLCPIILTGITIMSLVLFKMPKDINKESLKSQAYKLLQAGINEQNHNEAIEILLKLQTNISTDNKSAKPILRINALKVLIIFLACIIMLSIVPKTSLGIGKGKRIVAFYKFWIKFIVITIPSLIILPKLIDIVNRFIYG